jgi:hypothetical protein
MNNLKWFRFVQILRYGIDLARIFPIIINQRGTSRSLSWIYSSIEVQLTSWQNFINLEYLMQKTVTGLPTQVLESIF